MFKSQYPCGVACINHIDHKKLFSIQKAPCSQKTLHARRHYLTIL